MVTQGTATLPRLTAAPVPAGVQVCSLPDPLERVIGLAWRVNELPVPLVYAFLDVIRLDAIRGMDLFSTASVA